MTRYLRLGQPDKLYGWIAFPDRYARWCDYFLMHSQGIEEHYKRPRPGSEYDFFLSPMYEFPCLAEVRPYSQHNNIFFLNFFGSTPLARILSSVPGKVFDAAVEDGVGPGEMNEIARLFKDIELAQGFFWKSQGRAHQLPIPAISKLPVHEIRALAKRPGNLAKIIEMFSETVDPRGDYDPADFIKLSRVDSNRIAFLCMCVDAGITLKEILPLADVLEPLELAYANGVPLMDLFA